MSAVCTSRAPFPVSTTSPVEGWAGSEVSLSLLIEPQAWPPATLKPTLVPSLQQESYKSPPLR